MNIKIVIKRLSLRIQIARGKGKPRGIARIVSAAFRKTITKGRARYFSSFYNATVGVSPGVATGVNPGSAGHFYALRGSIVFKDPAVSRDFRGARVNLVATNFSGLAAEIRGGKKEAPGGQKRRGGSGAHPAVVG